jgi:peptidylprolyl isomerase
MLDQPPPPLPVAEAFRLPSVNTCVTDRRLTFTLRGGPWRRVTVAVDETRVRERTKAGRVRLRDLPPTRFTLSITAVRRDGRRATVERRYQPCLDDRPALGVRAGAPPTSLEVQELARGSGRQAKPGRDVAIHYAVARWSDGREIDASWDRGDVLRFPLGRGVVIKGFERGIRGMRIGGRRELVIPPALAYGDQGAPPDIGPGETLVAVVDLVSVSD